MPYSKRTMTSTLVASHKTVIPVALTQAQVPLLVVMLQQAVVSVLLPVLAAPKAMPTVIQ